MNSENESILVWISDFSSIDVWHVFDLVTFFKVFTIHVRLVHSASEPKWEFKDIQSSVPEFADQGCILIWVFPLISPLLYKNRY